MLKTKIEPLNKNDLTNVHEASLKVLEETGLVFHSEEALEILRKHGCKINDKIVYFPRKIVEKSLEMCPQTFAWKARNDSHSVTVGKGILTQPSVGQIYIYEPEHGRRLGTLQDFTNIQILSQASDVVDLVGGVAIDPSDVDSAKKHLYMTYEIIKNTDKPITGYTVNKQEAEQVLDMVELAMGEKNFLLKNHCIGAVICPLSPLAYAPESLETLIAYAKRNQIIFVAPCISSGISGPISLLGTAVLQNIEILAAIVLIQAINPGNPVVYSLATQTGYLKAATFNGGSPEAMLINSCNLQMALDLYKLPTRTICGVTESKELDCQAGYETMQNIIMGVLSGVHILTNTLGTLDSLLTTSYEKVIIDEELVRRAKRISQGVDSSPEALAVDIIQEVGHGGTYLTHQNTFNNFRNCWEPTVSVWDSYENLEQKGFINAVEKARKRYKEILASAPPSLIDNELDRELQRYMQKAFHE